MGVITTQRFPVDSGVGFTDCMGNWNIRREVTFTVKTETEFLVDLWFFEGEGRIDRNSPPSGPHVGCGKSPELTDWIVVV